MSRQESELYAERMQRTLSVLEALWWIPGTSQEDLFFLASELGLKNEFYQITNAHRVAEVG